VPYLASQRTTAVHSPLNIQASYGNATRVVVKAAGEGATPVPENRKPKTENRKPKTQGPAALQRLSDYLDCWRMKARMSIICCSLTSTSESGPGGVEWPSPVRSRSTSS
jgi:hypothetical protein